LYGAFVWAHRALNRQKRRFPARADNKKGASKDFDWPSFKPNRTVINAFRQVGLGRIVSLYDCTSTVYRNR
jgi:hypothetical protein